MKYLIIALFIFLIVFSCKQKKESFPSHFPLPSRTLTNEKEAELGKLLFFEPSLSGNGKLSCASCHIPSRAFSDTLSFSIGAKGELTSRNTPSLVNLAWAKDFFWDGGVHDLETQIIASVTSAREMNESFASILKKLNSKKIYQDKFREVYGDSITGQHIIHAIAAFELTLVSGSSAYDEYLLNKNSLTPLQEKGKLLFEQKCAICHTGVLFTDNKFHNTGLDSIFPPMQQFDNPLLGRARITQNASDIGKYRTPSLRNLNLTAPYMHDGRFTTIRQVLSHYSSGVNKSIYTDSLFIHNK